MGMFKAVATEQLKLLFIVLLLGIPFRAFPANHATNKCGMDLYLRVVIARHFVPLTAFAAFMLLLPVRAELRAAESVGARPFDNAPRWRRLWLRGTLFFAVALSFAASLLAVVAFQDGLLYRTGCHAGYGAYGAASPRGMLLIGVFALVHGFFAWVAVTQN